MINFIAQLVIIKSNKMKKYLKYMVAMMILMVAFVVPALAQETTESLSVVDYVKANWIDITGIYFTALATLKTIAKLTPTKKDDKVVAFLEKLQTLFMPDLKKGGGTHS